MNRWELLLAALALWTVLGVCGTLLALVRREKSKARQGIAWLVGVWVLYLAAVLMVSLVQGQRTVRIGQEQCFDEMCFRVTGVEEVPGFFGRNGGERWKSSAAGGGADRE